MTLCLPGRARALWTAGEAATDQADGLAGIGGKVVASSRDGRCAGTAAKSEECVAQGSQDLGTGARAQLAAILAEEDTTLPVTTLDGPVAPDQGQETGGAGLSRRAMSDEVPCLLPLSLFGPDPATDLHGLLDTEEEEMGVRALITRSRLSSRRPCCWSMVVSSVQVLVGSRK